MFVVRSRGSSSSGSASTGSPSPGSGQASVSRSCPSSPPSSSVPHRSTCRAVPSFRSTTLARCLATSTHDRRSRSASSLFVGSLVALIVQPVAAALSDYTRSRLGRRRPWILVGTSLDVIFLILLANSHTFLALAVLIVLLQFSSNLAQGPFQGYVPDLVPESQVGLASGLVGTMQVSGQLVGAVIAGFAVYLKRSLARLPRPGRARGRPRCCRRSSGSPTGRSRCRSGRVACPTA